jgi:hypothetical protein
MLKEACPHGRWEAHEAWRPNGTIYGERYQCPGGRLLPNDALELVWWCEVHRSIGIESCCDGSEIISFLGAEQLSPCRIVERALLDASRSDKETK